MEPFNSHRGANQNSNEQLHTESPWNDFGSFNLYPAAQQDQVQVAPEVQVNEWERQLGGSAMAHRGNTASAASVLQGELSKYLQSVKSFRPTPGPSLFDFLPVMIAPFLPVTAATGNREPSLLVQIAAGVPIKAIDPVLIFARDYYRNPKAVTFGDLSQFIRNVEAFLIQAYRFSATTADNRTWYDIFAYLKTL